MALTDSNGLSAADVAAVCGNNNGYGNGGFWGGDGSFWIIILFLFAFMGNGFGGGWGAGAGAPYVMNNVDSSMQRGFDQQAIMGGINGINASINSLAQGQCAGFNGVTAAVTNGLAQAEIANNARQIANLQGINGLAMGLQNCCCENRAAVADLKYTTATEACATRTADANNARDIIDSQRQGTQAILDKLCALELDGVKGQLAQAQRDNVALQNQLNMSNLAASQAAQTATFQQGMNAEVDALYNRLKSCPVPSMPVYGTQPIFTCNNGNGCGCGCGA